MLPLLELIQSGNTVPSARIAVMLVIFCVSLSGIHLPLHIPLLPMLKIITAVSFPTLSKRLHYLRIPPIVFFVGKHFGTGQPFRVLAYFS